MRRIIILTFTLLSLFNSSFSEIEESFHDEGVSFTHQHELDSKATYSGSSHQHGQSTDDEAQCLHFCTGINNMISFEYSVSFAHFKSFKFQNIWNFSNHYSNPSLQAGHRPPIS